MNIQDHRCTHHNRTSLIYTYCPSVSGGEYTISKLLIREHDYDIRPQMIQTAMTHERRTSIIVII